MKLIIKIILLLLPIPNIAQKTLLLPDSKIPEIKETNDKIVKWNESQKYYNLLNPKEKEFYYLVNFSRLNPNDFFTNAVLPIINIFPQLKTKEFSSLKSDLEHAGPLPLLKLNDLLIKTSKEHSIDITSHNYNPGHSSTNGESFVDRFKKNGLKQCGSENISFNSGDINPLFALVILYLDIGVQGLGHRETLLNPQYTETGIGISYYTNGNAFLVEDFACPQN